MQLRKIGHICITNSAMEHILQETAQRLLDIINEVRDRFASVTPEQWAHKPAENVWSKKELLGHLIDSAANNHLRFVRGQLAGDKFVTHGYEQDFFVSSQHYHDEPVDELIALWYAYNRHLAMVIRHIDPSKLEMPCFIGPYEPMSFSFVITDYVTHMQHHLKQVFS